MANRLFRVVPDTGTEKAARLATELTGSPGRWVRLDCGHSRHTQQPVAPRRGPGLPDLSTLGGWPTGPPPRPTPGPKAPVVCSAGPRPAGATTARQLAAQAVTAAGLTGVAAEVEQLVGELVANALGHTQAPLELTIDTRDDVVRVEVRDQAPSVALGLEEHPDGHRSAGGQAPTDPADRPPAGSGPGGGTVVWAELRGEHVG